MRPDGYPRVTVLLAQVRDEDVDRVSHVLVAQIPRGDAAAEHRAVVGGGIASDPRVLLSEELLVRARASVAFSQLGGTLLKLEELPDDFILAILRETERNHLPVDLWVVAEIVEAGVTGPARAAASGSTLSR